MERAKDKKGELLFTPEEAELLIPVVRARIQMRAEKRRRREWENLRRSAFSFNLFPRARKPDFARERAESEQRALEDIGDHLRLAILEYAAGRIK